MRISQPCTPQERESVISEVAAFIAASVLASSTPVVEDAQLTETPFYKAERHVEDIRRVSLSYTPHMYGQDTFASQESGNPSQYFSYTERQLL